MEGAEQTQPPRWRRRIRRVRKPPPQPQSQHQDKEKVPMDEDPTAISTGLFKSRKRFATELCSDKMLDDTNELALEEKPEESTPSDAVLSERRKALFEPLEPNINGKRPSAESLLPPPDFDAASYPKGWLIGKKRKLVNVDVVESMRRIAVQEMNRKDREIDGLNEQLEGDARVLEHLQIQLLEEKSKRTNVERENAMLQDQVNMLMDMLHDNENMADDGSDEP